MKEAKLKVTMAFLLCANFIFAQTISCDDLYNYVIKNGFKKSTIYNYTLNSTWLKEVTAYSLEGKIYVVAKIKKDEYGFSTSNYIFCGVPEMNWLNFEYPKYGDDSTYGERFHQLIRDYECNCS